MRNSIAAVLAVLAFDAYAAEFRIGNLVIVDPVVRATLGGAKVGTGYLTIPNRGADPDRLLGGESQSAARVEVHATERQGDVVRMRERETGLTIPANCEVRLSAGGEHLMFNELKGPFRLGQPVTATLIFERAGRVPITFSVEPIGGPSSRGHGKH
jgi:copper(I)-binding protein